MKKYILSILFVLVLFIFLLLGSFEYKTRYAKTEVLVSKSDDDYQLTVYMIGEPEFPFGSTHCLAVLIKDNSKITERNITLQNDGKIATDNNFEVMWRDKSVVVKAMAEEQKDEYYVLLYDGTSEVLDDITLTDNLL